MPHAVTVPDHSDLVDLDAGEASVLVAPTAGGRIAQITVSGQQLLVDLPAGNAHPMGWGSFPMAPWAGRIRGGQFDFDGIAHQLELNHVDGDGGPGRAHSIHGTVFTRSWDIVDRSSTTVTMTCPLAGALGWPFAGTAHQHIEVTTDRVMCQLWIDGGPNRFPTEIGWHPWFRKPDRLQFTPTAMYVRDRFGIPTGELVAPTVGPWDDCFLNTEPVVLHYDRPIAPAVTVTSDCDHWVVYDHPVDATCVEPQSGPPDALNAVAHLVDPDHPLHRTMTISW